MKTRTSAQTAIICAAGVLAVALVAIPLELKTDNAGANPAKGIVWLALSGVLALAVCGWTKVVDNGGFRIAKIADTAGPAGIREIAEIPHERQHPAARALTIGEHLLELSRFVLALYHVRFAELCVAAADVVLVVDDRSAVNPKLLERIVERLASYPAELSHLFLGPRLCSELGKDLFEQSHLRVIALEKEVVRAAVSV